MNLEQNAQQLQILGDSPHALSYEAAITIKNSIDWDNLRNLTVGESLELWLKTLRNLTAINYRSGMKQLAEGEYINIGMSLQAFALINHDAVVDRIKTHSSWAECTMQTRAACYISFTHFLCRRSQGMIKRAMPCKEGVAKTFKKVREKVETEAMTLVQWTDFLNSFTNPRDQLIAKLAIQGAKRINEVLGLTTGQICWEKREITFTQSKTKVIKKETVITCPQSVMNSLKEYIGSREGLVFITRTGKKVPLIQVATTFAKAGTAANIPFKVTPHVLRASAITYYKQQGLSNSDVGKITGQTDEMVNAYDKSSRAENASKKIQLVQ
jgi:integrase